MTFPPGKSPEAVYVHIPFCTNKCYYCDFNSYVLKGQPVMDYLHGLEREIERTIEKHPPGPIKTIFVGGGTPTVLTPEQMEVFLGVLQTYFPDRANDLEFTMEANPGTVDEEKLAAMKAGGVNRISFGVQSFNNRLLERIGRIHNTDDVYRSLESAKRIGFGNLSIDLMFGLPDQTVKDVNETLDAALELDLKHYSIYSLKVEENTLFHTLYQKNNLPLPSEDDEADMFRIIMERLGRAGYDQYEISNFAKPGFQSRHNMTYWKNQSYYGLGAGAHGYMQGVRHMNIKGIQPYIDATKERLPLLESAPVSREEAMEDFMMVGLRMLAGVREEDFQAQFGVSLRSVFGETVDRLAKKGLLVADDEGVRLSPGGIFLGNEVFAEFIGFLS